MCVFRHNLKMVFFDKKLLQGFFFITALSKSYLRLGWVMWFLMLLRIQERFVKTSLMNFSGCI